jgi:RNA polymerase-binding transcription factor DksA
VSKLDFDMEDRYSDPIDRASQLELQNLQGQREEHARKMKRDQEPDADGVYKITECEECFNVIPLGRLQNAIRNTLCTPCADYAEKMNKRWAR